MFYKLLGMLVWKGAKLFVRRKASSAAPPKPLVAGGLAVALLAIVAVALTKRSHTSS
jgi:hypothetical protein